MSGRDSAFHSAIIVMLLLAAAAFSIRGCAGDADQARSVLLRDGYIDIEVTGGAPLSCGRGDWKMTSFRARNPVGNLVTGAVCCGIFKNCTVRVEP